MIIAVTLHKTKTGFPQFGDIIRSQKGSRSLQAAISRRLKPAATNFDYGSWTKLLDIHYLNRMINHRIS